MGSWLQNVDGHHHKDQRRKLEGMWLLGSLKSAIDPRQPKKWNLEWIYTIPRSLIIDNIYNDALN